VGAAVKRTSFRAGVLPAEVQRLSRRTFSPITRSSSKCAPPKVTSTLYRHSFSIWCMAVQAGQAAKLWAVLGVASVVMSSACLLSISFPYKTFSFVPRFLFPWGYSPWAFLLWIAACVILSVIAGVRGSRLWLLGAAWAVFTLVFATSAGT
jgi:hypothetical protein